MLEIKQFEGIIPLVDILGGVKKILPKPEINKTVDHFLYNVDPLKVLGIDQLKYLDLKEKILKSRGMVKIVVHPYFSKK